MRKRGCGLSACGLGEHAGVGARGGGGPCLPSCGLACICCVQNRERQFPGIVGRFRGILVVFNPGNIHGIIPRIGRYQ